MTAIGTGKLDEAGTDDKVRRLLRLLVRTELLATETEGDSITQVEMSLPDPTLPRTVAAESIVLLKNEGGR